MAQPKTEKLIEVLWGTHAAIGASLYAILDGARNEGIFGSTLSSGCEYECLYRGELEPDLAAAAPYLVRLEKDHAFTYWLLGKGWGDSWGVFVQSAAGLRDLRQHFRKFLMVYDPNVRPVYFRYYDPRVLRAYLPTCNATDLETVFGPVVSYLVEDEDPNVLLRFSVSGGALQVQKTPLEAAQAA